MLINEDTNTLVFENLEIKVFAGENKYTLYDEIGQIDFEIKRIKIHTFWILKNPKIL